MQAPFFRSRGALTTIEPPVAMIVLTEFGAARCSTSRASTSFGSASRDRAAEITCVRHSGRNPEGTALRSSSVPSRIRCHRMRGYRGSSSCTSTGRLCNCTRARKRNHMTLGDKTRRPARAARTVHLQLEMDSWHTARWDPPRCTREFRER